MFDDLCAARSQRRSRLSSDALKGSVVSPSRTGVHGDTHRGGDCCAFEKDCWGSPACSTSLFVFEQGRKRWLVSIVTFRSTPVLVVGLLQLHPGSVTYATTSTGETRPRHPQAPLPRKSLVTETGPFAHRCIQKGSAGSLARVGAVVASGAEIRNTKKKASGKLQAEDLHDGTAAVGGTFSYSCKKAATAPEELHCGRLVNRDSCKETSAAWSYLIVHVAEISFHMDA